MYGKFFASTFTGSMFGAGPDVFALWGYVIATATFDGTVEVNPAFVAAVLGTTPDRVEAALHRLCSPDPHSRSQAEDGCRLTHEGAFQYRVVNHGHYRAMRSEEERRAYNREAKRRERSSRVKQEVIDKNEMSTMSAHTDTDTDTDKEREGPSAPAPAAAAIIQRLWNNKTTQPLPLCRALSPSRVKKCRVRLAEHPEDYWADVVDRIQASSFCRGQNDRGWVATFDWLIENADNAIKVLEGKYDNRLSAQATRALPPAYDANWCDHDPRCSCIEVHNLQLIRENQAL